MNKSDTHIASLKVTHQIDIDEYGQYVALWMNIYMGEKRPPDRYATRLSAFRSLVWFNQVHHGGRKPMEVAYRGEELREGWIVRKPGFAGQFFTIVPASRPRRRGGIYVGPEGPPVPTLRDGVDQHVDQYNSHKIFYVLVPPSGHLPHWDAAEKLLPSKWTSNPYEDWGRYL